MKKHETLALRLATLLTRLNDGERLDIHQLTEEFQCSIRTLQRDIKDRFAFLTWLESGPRYYQLDRKTLGILQKQDIERFALFASVANLFPKIDREFYQEKLTESVQVRGFQYEDISKREKDFSLVMQSIENKQDIQFQYTKYGQNSGKFYQLSPYSLINKNGIWYVLGMEQNKPKTFCFTQMSLLRLLDQKFEIDTQFLAQIKQNDSIYHGNQMNEVVIKISHKVAPYFLRRNLLPNQKLVHKLDSGDLLLSCENVHELDVVPIVQYWIPHLTIISPSELQLSMEVKIKNYLNISA